MPIPHRAAAQARLGFAGLEDPEKTFLYGVDGEVRAGGLVSVARRIATEIDRKTSPDTPVVPLFRRRGAFMATFCAALDRGRRVFLPPDDSKSAVNMLRMIEPNLMILAEDQLLSNRECEFDFSVPAAKLGINTILNPDPSRPLLQFFTSGSTDIPRQHTRTWVELERGGQAWRHALDLDGQGVVVATVPPQHMYGMEASVVLPLTSPRISVWDGQPLLPNDVRGALEAIPSPRVLVTTPVHLNALVRSGIVFPDLHCIVSATAPLTSSLALRAEECWNAPVLDVYGSTETGMIACRRVARTEVWQLREDVEMWAGESTIVVEGAGFPGQVALAARVELVSGGFRLYGREDDLVNVAGKRASLSGLSTILQGLDGVEDGAFWVPDDDDPEQFERPIAFVVTSTLSEQDVRSQLRGLIADIFIPRKVIKLPALPRSGSGKITRAALQNLWRKHAESEEHGI